MSTEENKAVIRRFWEAVNQGYLNALDDTLAASYKGRMPGLEPLDCAGVKDVVAQYRSAFPDLHVTIDDMIAEGDKVATRFTITGTHQGDLMGLAPTGKPMTVSGVTVMRFRDGKVAEEWEQVDMMSMMQQLGAMPSPAQAPA